MKHHPLIRTVAFATFSILSLVDCGSVSPAKDSQTTLCDLNRDSFINGHPYIVDALYVTDSSTFTALVDQRCEGSARRMQLSVDAGHGDRSVGRFLKDRSALCKRRGEQALCSLSAAITAEIVVERAGSGASTASLSRVLSYRFVGD